MSAETPITLSINPQDLRVQTFTVEKLLEPLIIQVTTLVNCPQNPSNRKKRRSKRARVLLASVEEATWNLLDKGEKIAQEATVLKEELTGALEEVRKESEALKVSAERFADDPCYLPKREAVVQAARALLAAVTRLLVLADMIDVMCLLQHVSAFQRTFESLKNVSNKSDLKKTYQKLGKELENLDYLAFKRQQDLKSPNQRDEIAGARASLKENSPILHSICSACLEHSDVASLKASKDTVCGEIQNALNVISNASQGIQNMLGPPEPQAATLGSALDELESLIVLDPLTVTEEEIRPSLEKRLEAIISGAALLADSSCTRDFHRERIIAECNAIRQALQDLLSEYMNNTGKKERSNTLNMAIENMCKKTRDLRRQLRKAIIDHVSDSFLDTTVPLLVLIEAAKNGREKEIKEYAAIFREHTSRLVEVANLACSMSTNEDGIKIVRVAANHLETLCPQIINAALALAARPKSQVVKKTMEMYKRTWENHIHVLTEAVDDITSIDDFLAVSEYIMRNAGLEETQTGIKIAGRNINNLRYADDTTLMAESEEELKSLLMKVQEESEKVGLKFNIQKTKIMASGPTTSWEIDGETVETVSDFIFLGSKITTDGDCSHEIKRRLLLGRKVMTNLDSLFKSRDITLPTKVRLVKAMVFSVVRYGCESWTVKKAEH
uniref:Catenin (Cadherin-associated protein), alpha 3 n=1 Tax=Bos taurus TaxID=9913 RepID=A0JNH2_BOVIN|nr:Catenin (cadherin-associated protein), alpha 3 [Bos taurus]